MTTSPSKRQFAFRNVVLPAIVTVLLVSGTLGALYAIPKLLHIEDVHDSGDGKTLTNFKLNEFKKGPTDLAHSKKKVTLINFWASWCDACMAEIPSLLKLREKFKDQGFEILGINVDENPNSAIPPLVKELHIDFPVYTDPEGEIASILEVQAIPYTVVVDEKLTILAIEIGGKNWFERGTQAQVEKWLTKTQ